MEDKSFEFIPPTGNSHFILTCEHASAHIPQEYKNLGLPDTELDRHIARDKGAAEICRLLAKELGCAAFLGKHSRLLIDLNRKTNEDELIVPESDKTSIPGNQNLSAEERQKRISSYYIPYYTAINSQIDELKQQGISPVLFSIHSYTPQLKDGDYRPWQAGILYHKETGLANHLLRGLSSSGKKIGENVPYDLRRCNTGTVIVCGEEKGLDYALIEIRDDEFNNLTHGAEEWAQILAPLLKKY